MTLILVTGGAGFIGTHVVRALHDLGESSVLLSRRNAEVPEHLADLPVAAEQGDVADLETLRAIGRRHTITGIVHLAGYPAPRGSVGGIDDTARLLDGLLAIGRVAQEWDVHRVGLASTIGVYSGVAHDGPLTEDLPLPLSSPHPIPRSKKISELLSEQLAEATGVSMINLRISGTWGPLGHEDPFFAAPALAHAAASGKPSRSVEPAAHSAPGGRPRPLLRQGHRPSDRPADHRRPARAPHLQRRLRSSHHEQRRRRSAAPHRARRRPRSALRGAADGAATRHHPTPRGHRLRAGVRHRRRRRRLHRLAPSRPPSVTHTTPSADNLTPAGEAPHVAVVR